jgi:hypothetical protein
MLARASARGREFAVRTALGAQRRHLARQLLCESACSAGRRGARCAGSPRFGCVGARCRDADRVLEAAPIRIDAACSRSRSHRDLARRCCSGASRSSSPGARARVRAPRRQSRRHGGPVAQRVRGALVVLNFALALALCVGGGLFFQSLRELGEDGPRLPLPSGC